MNQNRALMMLLLGLSIVGTASLPNVAAAQVSPPYNCRTREVWTPEKAQWCAEHMRQPSTSIDNLVGTEWQLTRLNGNPVSDQVQSTLSFESSDRIVGSGGCNRYFAPITVDGTTLTVGQAGSTMMACEPSIMDQETQFLASLQTATRFVQRGNTLRIFSEGQRRPLRFVQISSSSQLPPSNATPALMIDDLIGTEWQLEELNGSPISADIQTTLTVESSDRIVGKGGCNGYFAGMTVDGNTLSLSPIGATMAMCEPAVMDQESQFFLVLQSATRFEKEGDSLLIYSDASEYPLRFSPIGSAASTPSDLIASLVGTEWLLEDLNGTGVMDYAQTTLNFESSDRIVGSGGCNRYFGGLTVEDDRISFGAIGSTRMACPPAVMDQEARFFQALSTANQIELDGPYLLVYSEGIDQPLRFTQITPSVGE